MEKYFISGFLCGVLFAMLVIIIMVCVADYKEDKDNDLGESFHGSSL